MNPKLSADLVLSVSIADAIDALPSEDRARILMRTGFDRYFLKDVVSQLVSGVAGEHGDYWFDPSFYTELRAKLMDQMPEVTSELVRGLIYERDAAIENAKREESWAWQLFHAMPDSARKPARPGWNPTHMISEADAEALIAEAHKNGAIT